MYDRGKKAMINRNLVVNYMVAEIEKSFVKRFIKKTKQDRLLFELSGKKRKHGIERFCHSTEDMLSLIHI